MIKLINNEFNKIKKSKLFFSQIIFIIALFIMKKVSDNDLLYLSYNLIPFIGVSVSIFFGGIISSEIENGTFRQYLTTPVKRYKIYLSKLFSIFIYITLTIILIILVTFLLSKTISLKYIIKYFAYSIPAYFIGVFSLYLSTKFKSVSLCVGISIFTLTFSLIISQIFFGININIVEYTFLPYLDFSLFNDKVVLNNMNSELGINLNIYKGITIDIITMFILYFLGNRKFIKKDIKA